MFGSINAMRLSCLRAGVVATTLTVIASSTANPSLVQKVMIHLRNAKDAQRDW
jgi:hypothetical protein